MKSKTYRTTIVRDGSMCFIPVPFDPAPLFGKVRAPVKVTLNGYTYRSTIASMGGTVCIPLRKSHREAAGLRSEERRVGKECRFRWWRDDEKIRGIAYEYEELKG